MREASRDRISKGVSKIERWALNDKAHTKANEEFKPWMNPALRFPCNKCGSPNHRGTQHHTHR